MLDTVALDDDAFAGELWGAEQLEQHARLIARRAGPPTTGSHVDLTAKLKSNAARLESAYRSIVAALRAGRAITPSAEWFIDNYHVVVEQVNDLPQRLTPAGLRMVP